MTVKMLLPGALFLSMSFAAGAEAPDAPRHGSMAQHHVDNRTPLPLSLLMANHQKQNMRAHLEAVQAIVAGLAAKDFPAIEAAAASMGYSREMEGQCQRIGAGAPGFAERAIAFHKTADEISAAAHRKDADGVLASLSLTLAQCTGCHATYKQEIFGKDGRGGDLMQRMGGHH
ncbi:MAG: hypothetical protein ACOY5H_13560 [Pseudomonadota bacterium]|nr:hypothetical protein [Candidatus Acidoferrales bacterium]